MNVKPKPGISWTIALVAATIVWAAIVAACIGVIEILYW